MNILCHQIMHKLCMFNQRYDWCDVINLCVNIAIASAYNAQYMNVYKHLMYSSTCSGQGTPRASSSTTTTTTTKQQQLLPQQQQKYNGIFTKVKSNRLIQSTIKIKKKNHPKFTYFRNNHILSYHSHSSLFTPHSRLHSLS